VAFLIDDADLLDRISTMLAEEADIVILDIGDNPDVVITDHLPFYTRPPTIVLGDRLDGSEALGAGASGVLPRDCPVTELVLAIEAAARGFAIMPRDLAKAGSSEIDRNDASGGLSHRRGANLLTARELQVLRFLAEGASNKLIARRLGISVHTAKFHVASIATKLDAIGRTDAVAQAVRLGLIML
jgi:DNA-binding NarL/FixJ family response regulator